MKNILVCGQRSWSLDNIKPALDNLNDPNIVFTYWNLTDKIPLPVSEFNLVITCEPHSSSWIPFYYDINNTIPVIALQQGLYWSNESKPNTTWAFDKYMIWGEQMKECCLRNGLTDDKLIITGCPKHDKMFHMETEDHGHILYLNDAWLNLNFFTLQTKIKYTKIIETPHPVKTQHSIQFDTLEHIRTSRAVVCGETGCGIWAMILKKPFMAVSIKHRRHDYDKSRVLNIKDFSLDYDAYLKWAVTGDGAIEKVQNVIKGYL